MNAIAEKPLVKCSIQAEGVHLSYGNRPVLAGMDLHVSPGEVVGLVGPNGSGKSTFLRIAAGTLSPQQGRVLLGGEDVADLKPKDRAKLVAVVQQSPAAPPGFTAMDVALMGRNPHLGLLQWESKSDYDKCRRVMELTETWEFADRQLSTLSGGELQRVFMARALAQETPALLLDEPTAHLDISYQTATLDIINRVRKQSDLTVIVAMHDLTLAAQYCDRIAVLYEGSVLACGEPSETLNEEVVSKAFGAPVYIIPHPATGTPVVLPMGQSVSVKEEARSGINGSGPRA